jgi:hypothetical protein
MILELPSLGATKPTFCALKFPERAKDLPRNKKPKGPRNKNN